MEMAKAQGGQESVDEFLKRRSLVSVYGFFIYKRDQNKMFAEYLVSDYLARENTGVKLFNAASQPLLKRKLKRR